MTNWNKYGSPLMLTNGQSIDSFEEFLETLSENSQEPFESFWLIDNDGEIQPISYLTQRPLDYVDSFLEIVKWLKKKNLNCESGYSFTYQNEEEPDERSVGGINSNNEGVTVVQIDGNGKITQEFHKL